MVAKLPLIGFILIVVAFVIDLCFSFGTMWWIYRKVESGSSTTKYNLGLWRECTSVETSGVTVDTCYRHTEDNFSQDKKFLGTMQVFQATGFVYLIISIVCGILMLFIAKFKENPMLPPIVAAHAFWAGLFFIGSCGAAGREVDDSTTYSSDDLHFSFGFAIIAGIVALVGAVILIVDIVKGASSGGKSSPSA